MYERMGLRVTAYKSGPPEIQITLDPNALPPVTEAAEVLEGLQETVSEQVLDEVKARILRPYVNTVLDEETGEWVRVEDSERKLEIAIEREGESEYEDSVPNDSTSSTRRTSRAHAPRSGGSCARAARCT
jgi:hypothetical protein